jgi:hypothetical protein
MATASGATDRAFQKQEKTFATFKNELQKSAIVFGNIAKFFIDDIAGGAQKALEAINEFVLSGRAMSALTPIIEKVAAAFNVISTFVTNLFNLIKGTFIDAINDIKDAFGGMSMEIDGAGIAFNALAVITEALGFATRFTVKMMKLLIFQFIDAFKIGISLAKVYGTLWQVITGKKKWADVKDSLSKVKDA